MRMPKEVKDKILGKGAFLEGKGFVPQENEYGVDYFNGKIKIMAYYERYENRCGVDIKFPGNKHFQIAWIAFIRDGVETAQKELEEKIFVLIEYLERNFDNITDFEYCEESGKLLDKYFESEEWQKRKQSAIW